MDEKKNSRGLTSMPPGSSLCVLLMSWTVAFRAAKRQLRQAACAAGFANSSGFFGRSLTLLVLVLTAGRADDGAWF